MIYPQPKPPARQKKTKTRLKVNVRLKVKNKNPLPTKTVTKVYERDNWECQMCGGKLLSPPHHIVRRSQASLKWKHDERNLITLCIGCHDKTETSRAFFLEVQKVAVARFGWFAGQSMTVEEWEDRYGQHIFKR